MSSYEEKYKKYKKMYLDLKTSQKGGMCGQQGGMCGQQGGMCGQQGGVYDQQVADELLKNILKTNMTDSNIEMIARQIKSLEGKFKSVYKYDTPLDQYHTIISELEKFCSEEKLSDAQIEEKTHKIFSLLGSKRIVEHNLNTTKITNWQEYHHNICIFYKKTLIPALYKEFMTQAIFMLLLVNNKSKQKIDVDKYMDFAKHESTYNSMFEHGIVNEKDIRNLLTKYMREAEVKSEKWRKEKEEAQLLLKSINKTIPNVAHAVPIVAAAATGIAIAKNIDDSIYPLSKNNRQCKTPCTTHKDFFKGKYCSCKVEPYKNGLFGKKDWDYCQTDLCPEIEESKKEKKKEKKSEEKCGK